jgi:hypothetical protein
MEYNYTGEIKIRLQLDHSGTIYWLISLNNNLLSSCSSDKTIMNDD